MTCIQNKQSMAGGYNLLNAAYNFCESNEVIYNLNVGQQILGRQAFRLYNFLTSKKGK